MSLEAVFSDTAMLAKELSFFTLCIDTDTLAKWSSREQPNICYKHSRVCERNTGGEWAVKVPWDQLTWSFRQFLPWAGPMILQFTVKKQPSKHFWSSYEVQLLLWVQSSIYLFKLPSSELKCCNLSVSIVYLHQTIKSLTVSVIRCMISLTYNKCLLLPSAVWTVLFRYLNELPALCLHYANIPDVCLSSTANPESSTQNFHASSYTIYTFIIDICYTLLGHLWVSFLSCKTRG